MIGFFRRKSLGRDRFIDFNKSYFKKKLNSDSNSEVLIEFNAFHPFHTMGSIIANRVAKRFSSKIVAFFNYALVVSPLQESFFNQIRWLLGNKFNLKTFRIYRSFGIYKFIKPDYKIKHKNKIEQLSEKIIKNIKKKEDIISIHVNKVLIGDLLYDSYIKYYKTYTVQFETEKFHKYLRDFLYLFFYWQDYLKKNKVKCVIGVHSVYSYGLLLRLAIYNKIRVILVNNGQIFSLNKKRMFAHCEYLDFKKKFQSLGKNYKITALKIAKESLENRFKGNTGSKINDLVFSSSSFKKKTTNNNFKIFSKNKKIRVLIAAHEVHDAPNPMGKNFFSDFYEWMIFVMETAKNTNYDWYLKNHPLQKDMKLFNNQQLTVRVTDSLLKKYPNIKNIDSEISHKQIIAEGIDFVLTVRGTIAVEYAYKGIPVLMATKNNFTKPYNFNFYFKDKNDYKKTLLNLHNLDFSIKSKNEVLEYYFMRYIYSHPNYFFNFFSKFREKVKNFDHYWTDNFYLFYTNEIKNNLEEIENNFDYFFKTKDYIMEKKHNIKAFEKIFSKV